MSTGAHPKKVPSSAPDTRAWWYALKGGIEVYIHVQGRGPIKVNIPRSQLKTYIERTEK